LARSSNGSCAVKGVLGSRGGPAIWSSVDSWRG
jgi:hypothetical protein